MESGRRWAPLDAPPRTHDFGLSVGLHGTDVLARSDEAAGPSRLHLHNDVELNFVLHGEISYLIGSTFHAIPPERLVVFWGGLPHGVLDMAPDTAYIWATVPLAWVLQWNLDSAFLRHLLSGEVLGAASDGTAAEDHLMLERWLHAQPGPVESRVRALDLEARLVRLGANFHSMASRQRLVGGSRLHEHLVAAIRHISLSYTETLSAADVAAAVGVNPKYLMQVFKQSCGMTLWEYVLRLRIAHAQRLLLGSDTPIVDVSLESGFGSLNRFYAAFTRYCGTTPAAYRAAQRAA